MTEIGNSRKTPSPPRSRRLMRSAFAAVSALAMIAVTATPALAAPPQALPENASAMELKWQPVFDYDKDSCYPTPAIGPDGTLNPGLKPGGFHESFSYGCRDESYLHNTNSYSRQLDFPSGWSAIVYGLYFEKDTAVWGLDAVGHRHDWEHVVVWVIRDKAEWVGVSQHGGYSFRRASDVLWEGTHPKIVYHKAEGFSAGGTHAMRFDAGREGQGLQNGLKQWHRPPLVGWDGFRSIDLRNKLTSHSFGGAHMDIADRRFQELLNGNKKAIPPDIR